MLSSVGMNSPDEFSLYKDQVFYSHDGLFIFFLVINSRRYLEKAIVVNSNYLSIPDKHEILLSHLEIRGADLEGEPALLWGHQDTLEMDDLDR